LWCAAPISSRTSSTPSSTTTPRNCRMRDAEYRQPFFLKRNNGVHPVCYLRGRRFGNRETGGSQRNQKEQRTHYFLPHEAGAGSRRDRRLQ